MKMLNKKGKPNVEDHTWQHSNIEHRSELAPICIVRGGCPLFDLGDQGALGAVCGVGIRSVGRRISSRFKRGGFRICACWSTAHLARST